MTEKTEKRIKFWNINSKKYSENEIKNFEKKYGFLLPGEYKLLLSKYGKIEHTKYWYYYKKDNDEYLLDSSISIDDHEVSIDFYWKEIEESNPHLAQNNYLPIFGTHSPNFFFLVALDKENFGKIYEYDSDYEDFEPVECASSFFEFFEEKIYSTFSIHSKAKSGTIEIFRQNGLEIWDVTSSNLSITNEGDLKSVNFWVESDYTQINALSDTGNTPVMCEIKFPLTYMPDFNDPWKFSYPTFEKISENWGEESNLQYYDNFYYYIHQSFDNQTIEIVKDIDDYYYIKLEGEKDDPLSSEYGKAKYIITVKLKMQMEFNGLWCEKIASS